MENAQQIISSLLLDEVERMLPDIVSSLSVQPQSSAVADRKEELMQKRRKRKYRKETISENETRISNDIDYIKRRFEYSDIRRGIFSDSGFHEKSLSTNYHSTHSSQINKNHNNGHKLSAINSRKRISIPEFGDYYRDITKQNMHSATRMIDFYTKQGQQFHVEYGKSLWKDMMGDKILEDVINTLSDGLSRLFEDNNINCDLYIERRDDVEYKDWKKIFFYFQINEKSYDKKIKIWEQLDIFIRNNINKSLKHKYRLGSASRRLKSISNVIYTDINI